MTIHFGKAGRYKGLAVENPRFGYNYFFFFPKLFWNGGVPWRRQVVDISFHWLIYWVNFTRWPKPNGDYTATSKIASKK